jgi:hypothetical protein
MWNTKGLIIVSIAFIMAFSFVILCYHREYRQFPKVSWKALMPGRGQKPSVRCSITSPMGRRGALKVEINIPCEDTKQQRRLSGLEQEFQSDFLTTVDHMALEAWIEERNYEAIRAELLRVINRHTAKPIERIYFESLLYR